MTAPAKILIATFGSYGDLFPFLALGQALRSEGYAVHFATSADYRDWVERQGFGFAPIRPDLSEVETKLGFGLGGLARAMSADDAFLFQKVIFPHLGVAFDEICAASAGATAIVAHGIAFAAHAAAEKRGLPLFVTHLSPALSYSAYDPPRGAAFPFIWDPRRTAALVYNRALLWGLGWAAHYWAAQLRRFRLSVGLPAAGPFGFFRPPAAGAPTIALYSPLLAPPQPDHSPGMLLAGHTFFDQSEQPDAGEMRGLETFLEDGPAPILFTLGSFVVHERLEHHRACVEAARLLNRRAIVLADGDDITRLRAEAPATVHIAPYAPHSIVMPRAAALVHHGGVGTCGQALRAGRPQLVTPFLGDQADNAARLVRLGVARVLPARRFDVLGLERELRLLLEEPSYESRAAACAKEISGEDGATTAARWIGERLGRVAKTAEIPSLTLAN